MGAPYAVRVYDAAPAPKNKVLLQGPLRKVYSISNVYALNLPLLYVLCLEEYSQTGLDENKPLTRNKHLSLLYFCLITCNSAAMLT